MDTKTIGKKLELKAGEPSARNSVLTRRLTSELNIGPYSPHRGQTDDAVGVSYQRAVRLFECFY